MKDVYRFDLITIIKALRKHRNIIIGFTLSFAILGAVLSFLKPKKYEADTEFFLQNPFYADRNFIFNYETKFIDYFAGDADIERIRTLASSDTVLQQIIDSFELAEVYDIDTTEPEELVGLREIVASNVQLLRTDSRAVLLTYTDKDAQRSANIANAYAYYLELSLRNIYNSFRGNMRSTVSNIAAEEDSIIHILTDSLTKMRDQYGIYDMLNPSRYSFILTPIKPNGKDDFAEGIEKIQNVAALKDELVKNMAGHMSLGKQYDAGTGPNEMKLTHIIKTATKPTSAKGPGLIMVLIAATCLGFFFSTILVLLLDYYSYVKKQLD